MSAGIDDDDDDTPLDEWATKTVAAAAAGVTGTTIRRWYDQSDIRGEKRAGVWHYAMADVMAMAHRDAKDNDDDDDDPAKADSPTRVLAALVPSVRQTQKHVENLLAPNRLTLQILQEENERLRRRNGELEDRLVNMLDVHEKALTLEHERRMAREAFDLEQSRKGKAFETAMAYIPHITSMVSHKLLPGSTSTQETILAGMVENITDEQIEAMRKANVLEAPQLTLLMELREQLRKAAKARELEKANGQSDGSKENQGSQGDQGSQGNQGNQGDQGKAPTKEDRRRGHR
jgi:hypothetical protein